MGKERDIESDSLIIIDFLKSRIEPVAIYIYGSILNSYFNDKSDIDIAVITGIKSSSVTLYELASELSVIVKRDIHLVDFLQVSDILRIEILKTGRLIYNGNDSRRLYHEMNALTAYEKLNEEREIAIKAKYGEEAWKSL